MHRFQLIDLVNEVSLLSTSSARLSPAIENLLELLDS